MALLLAGSSFTPSLLPRSPILQGLLAGIVGAFGYGVGETIAWAVRRVTRWRPSPSTSRRAWRVLGIVGAAFTIVVLVAGWRWQVDLHELMGVDAPAGYDSVLIAVVALLVFVGLVALGRVLRRLTGWVLRHTVGRLPLWLARTIAVTAVVLLVVGVLSGVIFRGFIAVSNATFSVKDTTTDAGAVQPTAPRAIRQPGLAHRLGHPRAAGPQLRRPGADEGRDRRSSPVDRPWCRSGCTRVCSPRRPCRRGRTCWSRICAGPAASTARRWSS